MNLYRSSAHFDNPDMQAVVDRYNSMFDERKGKGMLIDWGELFAEMVHAYVTARFDSASRPEVT